MSTSGLLSSSKDSVILTFKNLIPSLATARAVLIGGAISLLWLFLQPLARDQLNLNIVAVALLLVIAGGLGELASLVSRNRVLSVILATLAGLSFVSTFFSGGGLSALRDVALVSAVFLLGLSLSSIANRRVVLWGLVGGAVLVGIVGWALSIRRNGWWTGFDYSFVGVTSNGGPEHFSALVGLVAAVSLVSVAAAQLALSLLAVIFLGFTLAMTGPSIAVFTLLTTFVGALTIWVLKSASRVSKIIVVVGVSASAVVGMILVSNRSIATRIAREIGEFNSVDARYVIWDSAVQAITPWGWGFGHGAYFWSQGASTRESAVGAMLEGGYRAYSHAHSAYLDLFLAFGIAGVGILLLLTANVARRSLWLWRNSNRWSDYALAPIILFSLGVQAISQSNLVVWPLGWFACGALLGLLAVVRESEVQIFEWAPWGSNPRPTD